MERNLWLGTGFTGLCMVAAVAVLLLVPDGQLRSRVLWMLLLCLLSLPYYARKSQIIKRLRDASGSVVERVCE